MLHPLSRWFGLVACVSAACAAQHEPSPSPSAGLEIDASAAQPSHDPSPIESDPPLDSGRPIESMPYDAALPDASADAAMPFEDAGVEATTFAAVRGQLCDIRELVGIVLVIKDAPPYEDFIARSVVYQERLPIAPELSVTRGACRFYDVPTPPVCGDACDANGLACVGDGVCGVWPPELSEGARLTLSNAGASQVQNAHGETRTIELEGALDVRLEFGRYVVTLDAMAIPEPIAGLEVVRNGQSAVPETIDVRWPAPVDGHVYAYSFARTDHPLSSFERYTECIADGAALEMPIEHDVLAPFVGGGFQFQGVDHAYFAAATTPTGCVEIRSIYRYWHDRWW